MTKNVNRVYLMGASPPTGIVLKDPSIRSIGAVSAAAATDPAPAGSTVSATLDKLLLRAAYVVPGNTVRGATFRWRGQRYLGTTDGELRTNINDNTGAGTAVGSVELSTGNVWISEWAAGANPALDYWSMFQAVPPSGAAELPADSYFIFRTAAAPLRPESFQLVATLSDGTAITASADANGHINHSRVKGFIDYEYGVGMLYFCNPSATALGTVDVSHLGIEGVTTINADTVLASTVRYNAVAYEYIPVDPEVVGVDPVRLPSDGRVPIYNVGDYVVVHKSGALAPQEVETGQTINIGVERLSRIWITDAEGQDITWGWARDLDAGTVQILLPEEWEQPVTVRWSIEHMALVRELDISGAITLNRKLPADFPAASSYLSTALMIGDRFARVSLMFDQNTWDGTSFLDYLSGNAATATYNDTAYPIEVDNTGALTERWVIRFTSATAFQLIGEHVGVVDTGTTGTDFAPENPATGTPYMTVRAGGWGTGWAAGNIVRINTVGALKGFACIRAVQPGDYTSLDHRFALLARVDVDREPGEA